MSKDLQVTNAAVSEGISCVEQLFKASVHEADYTTLQQRLVAAMSYTASTAFYAGKTPENILDNTATQKDTQALGVEEQTIDGTTVTHMNKEKLEAVVDRVLKIRLDSLSNIVNKDGRFFLSGDKSDPGVSFSCGISMSTSKFQNDTKKAQFNTDHYLFIRKTTIFNSGNNKLDIYVFDRDNVTMNNKDSLAYMKKHSDVLGSVSYDVNTELKQTGRHYLPITFDTSRFGSDMKLELYYEFMTVNEFCEQQNRAHARHWLDEVSLENRGEDWKGLLSMSKLPSITLSPLIYFNNTSSSTEGWIHSYIEQKVIIVGFKGTDPRQATDLLTDAKIIPATLEGMYQDNYILKPTETLLEKDVKVHKGFLDAYLSVRETVLETVDTVSGWDPEWLVIFTGHSLGGALATLAAYEAANRTKHGRHTKVAMMNYGCPRLANKSFVKTYTDTVKVSYRFRAPNDIIPCLPRHLEHVPNLVEADKIDGLLATVPAPDKQQASANAEDSKDRKLSISNIVDAVKNAFKDHMEGNYFKAFSDAMKDVFKHK
eukprot:g2715.t1